MNVTELKILSWWPLHTEARIHAGQPGHEKEIVVNFSTYHQDNYINDLVYDAFVDELPESWKIENRSTRIEVHPSGRFFGGYCTDDIHAVKRALTQLGFIIGEITTR